MAGGRRLNEALMRSIASRWRTDQTQFFESIAVFPPGKEDRIVGHFVSNHYPSEIDAARIEFRLRMNGDVNLHYHEEWTGASWACRWDRHPNPHNAYEHFHQPPVVRRTDTDDVAYHEPPFGVIDIAFDFIEDRVGDLWDGPLTYPSSDTFEWEYGPDIRD